MILVEDAVGIFYTQTDECLYSLFAAYIGYNGKIGVCCYSSLAERSAENHENSVFTSIDYQSITNNSQTGFL